MNIPERVEEFAKNLSASVRKFAGYGQYLDDGVEQKAYRDGVETAIGMMYIDITGTPKTSGMLVPLLTETDQQARSEAWQEAVDLADRIELREPDGGTKQWMAFKAFRNTLRDKIKDQALSNPPSQV